MRYFIKEWYDKEYKEVNLEELNKYDENNRYDDCCVLVFNKCENNCMYFEYSEYEC